MTLLYSLGTHISPDLPVKSLSKYDFEFFWPNCFMKQFLVIVSNISTPLLILWINSLLIWRSTLTIYSFSWLFFALSILFTISPSFVKKINPSLCYPIFQQENSFGIFNEVYYIVFSTRLSVVQTIPTGLLKAK